MSKGVEYEKALARRASYDSLALQTLYELYFQRIYKYVSLRINHPQDAEDIVSNIFVQVIEGLSEFNNRYEFSFAAWMFTIARNAIVDFYRQRGRTPQESLLEEIVGEPISNSDPFALLIELEKHSELLDLLSLLPNRRREAITLKYFRGLRNLEIADVMRIDEHTVASHLSRGLKDLYEAYEEKTSKLVKLKRQPGYFDDNNVYYLKLCTCTLGSNSS